MQPINIDVRLGHNVCRFFFVFLSLICPCAIMGQSRPPISEEKSQVVFACLDSIDVAVDSCSQSLFVGNVDVGSANNSMPANRLVSFVKRVEIGSDSALTVDLFIESTKNRFNPYRSIAIDEHGKVYRLQGWNCSDLSHLLEVVGMHEYASHRRPVDTVGAMSIVRLALILERSYGNELFYSREWNDLIWLHDTSIVTCYGVVQISPPIVKWRLGFQDYSRYDVLFSVLFYTFNPYPSTDIELIAHEVIVTWHGELIHSMVDMYRPCNL